MKALVCGAGVNGIACALYLKRKGAEVTLIDRAEPASGTSYGNAGILASGAVIPVTVPGIARKAPGMLLDRSSPLFLRWMYLPRLAPFLRRYLGHATAAHIRHYAQSMSMLLGDSVAQHRALAAQSPAAAFIGDEDFCFAYATRAAFDADGWTWDLRRSVGLPHEVSTGAEFAREEPLYQGRFDTVVRNLNHGRINDPGAYLRALFDEFLRLGGRFQSAEVTGLRVGRNGIDAVCTRAGDLEADRYAFTLGPWSGDIARKLGLNVPFESEGGYHIELIGPSQMPGQPVMVASGKFVVTPMRGRLRLAGLVDFAGLDAPDNAAALDLLKRNAAALFPDLQYERMETWHGFRPTTANSLPLIGQVAALPNVYVGFGHQHVGLTGGAKTGAILSDLMLGEPAEIDVTAFDPNAYA